MGRDRPFCFSSICKSGRLKNPFASITSLSELYFRFRFILLVQTKKVIPMNYGSSTSSWKPWRWVRFDLILTMRELLTLIFALNFLPFLVPLLALKICCQKYKFIWWALAELSFWNNYLNVDLWCLLMFLKARCLLNFLQLNTKY